MSAAMATSRRRSRAPEESPPGRPRLRVLIVSPPTMVGEALAEALGTRGVEVVTGTLPSGQRALRELGRIAGAARAPVGLLVAHPADPAETRAVDAVLAGVPARWLALTCEPIGPQWGALLEAGAVAVVPSSASLEDLHRALLGVALGRDVIAPELATRLVEEWHEIRDAEQELVARLSTLTPREMAVLNSLSEGDSVKDIARKVGVSEGTVRSQVKSILRKLGVRSQLAGVVAYQRLGELRRRIRRAQHQEPWLL